MHVAGGPDKVIMLLDAMHPLTVMEVVYLHVLPADMYTEHVDVVAVTYPKIGLMWLVRSWVPAADDHELV